MTVWQRSCDRTDHACLGGEPLDVALASMAECQFGGKDDVVRRTDQQNLVIPAVARAGTRPQPTPGFDLFLRKVMLHRGFMRYNAAMILAVYSAKGGVGKTTLAVNIAWASAALAGRTTLLWDLDAQAGSSYVLRGTGNLNSARDSLVSDVDPETLVQETNINRLGLLPADASLRDLDLDFHALGKRRRLAKLSAALAKRFDTVVLDCPPGLSNTSDQILRAADLVLVPVVPSVLSRRALDVIKKYVAQKKGPRVILAPVFSMVDRRRGLHRGGLEQHPGWPVIPMASAFERMAELRLPVGEFMPRDSVPVQAIASLWSRVEKAVSG